MYGGIAHAGCIFQFQITHLIKNKATRLSLCNIITSGGIIQGHLGTTTFHTWLRWYRGPKQNLQGLTENCHLHHAGS